MSNNTPPLSDDDHVPPLVIDQEFMDRLTALNGVYPVTPDADSGVSILNAETVERVLTLQRRK